MLVFDVCIKAAKLSLDDSSSGFWQNFWISIIGSAIGAGAALLVFYLESRREKKKDAAIKRENARNALRYFLALLHDIVDFAEKQVANYREHKTKLHDAPYEFHLLHIVLAEDLKRVLHRTDHERLFHAFTDEIIMTQETDLVKGFKRVFAYLDYIMELYNQANSSAEKFMKEHTERMYKYRTLAEDGVLNYCANLGNMIRSYDPGYQNNPLYQAINNAITNYYANMHGSPTMERIQNNLVIPLRDLMVQQFRFDPHGNTIADKCRAAVWLYSEIAGRSQFVSQEFDEYAKNMDEIKDKLKNILGDIKLKAI